ncbi:MAG: hypothetical protein EZS28_050799 [Streblomastix strix]|uniref:Uncharacterized protein n=1 Tax=Streblomastix strix TaxID=222440 RepID=A0A5J4T5Q5_9EUKA|nr:MAG: hypothetical protein EZS28_050799 [Streblomastix strix]
MIILNKIQLINKIDYNLLVSIKISDKWFTIQTDVSSSELGATLILENLEKAYAYGELKNYHLKSSNKRMLTAVWRAHIEISQSFMRIVRGKNLLNIESEAEVAYLYIILCLY